MDIALLRDWVIIIQGIMELLLIIAFLIVVLVLYIKVNRLIRGGERAIKLIKKSFVSPSYKWALVFGLLASALAVFLKIKRKDKIVKENNHRRNSL